MSSSGSNTQLEISAQFDNWKYADFFIYDPSTYDFSNEFEPLIGPMPNTTAIPDEMAWDWSNYINPTSRWLSEEDDLLLESPTDRNNSDRLLEDRPGLKDTISELKPHINGLEQDVGARLAQIEDSLTNLGQRLAKAEEAIKARDHEMEKQTEKVRAEITRLIEQLREWWVGANDVVE